MISIRHVVCPFIVVFMVWLALGSSILAGELDQAWQEVRYVNFRGAYPAFEKAQEQAVPGSDDWIEAALGLAVCLHHRLPDTAADKQEAAERYDELIAATAGRPVQALALLFRARLADQVDYFGDEPDPATALRLYDRILVDWPGTQLAHQAALYRAQLKIFAMDPATVREAIDELESWLKQHPGNGLAAQMWLLIGDARRYPLNEIEQAVAAFRQAEKVGLPETMALDAFYWKVANLAAQAGQRELAIEYYRHIISVIQRTRFAYESGLRLRQLGVEPPPLVDPFAVDSGARPLAPEVRRATGGDR